jgi:hypothetical protein
LRGTKELLLAYDIGSNELSEDFEDLNDPKIALVGLFALALESEESNETVMKFYKCIHSFCLCCRSSIKSSSMCG